MFPINGEIAKKGLEIALILIDKCKEILNYQKEQNQNLLKNFIDPALSSFEDLHKNYMESFKLYRKLVEESKEPLDEAHPIFKQVKEDSLFSGELRSKAAALITFFDDPKVGSFISKIYIYIFSQADFADVLENGTRENPTANYPRRKLINGLSSITEEQISNNDKKIKALETTEVLIKDMLYHHFLVIEEYTKLKVKISNPQLKSYE
jgi:hypothetical protein